MNKFSSYKRREGKDMWEQTVSVSTRKTMKNDKENAISFVCPGKWNHPILHFLINWVSDFESIIAVLVPLKKKIVPVLFQLLTLFLFYYSHFSF